MEITYLTLVDRLLEVVPELRDAYNEELEWWAPDQAGPHIIYGDLLNPYLTNLLESGGNPDALKRIFGLLEEIIGNPNEPIRSVAAASVLEYLWSEKRWRDEASNWMGPRTRLFCETAYK